jgi:hypothetical protein
MEEWMQPAIPRVRVGGTQATALEPEASPMLQEEQQPALALELLRYRSLSVPQQTRLRCGHASKKSPKRKATKTEAFEIVF